MLVQLLSLTHPHTEHNRRKLKFHECKTYCRGRDRNHVFLNKQMPGTLTHQTCQNIQPDSLGDTLKIRSVDYSGKNNIC